MAVVVAVRRGRRGVVGRSAVVVAPASPRGSGVESLRIATAGLPLLAGDHEQRRVRLGRAADRDHRDREVRAGRELDRGRGRRWAGRAAARRRRPAAPSRRACRASVARTGWYWPEGHHAHASAGERAPRPRATRRRAAPGGRRSSVRALPTRAATSFWVIRTLPSTGRNSANRRSSEASTVEDLPSLGLVRDRRDDRAAAVPGGRGSRGSRRTAPSVRLSRTGTMTSTHDGDEQPRAAGQRGGLAACPGSSRRSVGPMCA